MTKARTLFLADWCDALFVHFRVEPRLLGPMIPFDLDLRDGDAYVSLVAFTQKRLRFARGGRIAAFLAAPLAQHEFLNLRTYVRANGQPGIFFLAEWIPNRLATSIGPRTYGLPYRLGTLRYSQQSRIVRARGSTLEIRSGDRPAQYESCFASSLDEFLLERYVAFTRCRGVSRRFDVAHAPWQHARVAVDIIELGLVRSVLPWIEKAHLIGANFSPGAFDVQISPPQRMCADARVDVFSKPEKFS